MRHVELGRILHACSLCQVKFWFLMFRNHQARSQQILGTFLENKLSQKLVKVKSYNKKLFIIQKKIEIMQGNQNLYWKSDFLLFQQLLAWWFFKVSKFPLTQTVVGLVGICLIWCPSPKNYTTAKEVFLAYFIHYLQVCFFLIYFRCQLIMLGRS